MRARREVILSAFCALLVACGVAESGSATTLDPTVEGVGVLPGTGPEQDAVTSDSGTTTTIDPGTTTTALPVPTIGSQVAGNRLLMIGDSITASAAERYGGELCDALVPLGWQVEVDAEPSRFVDFGNQVLDSRLAAKWDAAYVFLGTNYLGDQAAYRKQLEKIVQRLEPTPVVLLTVTLFDDSRQQVNDAITLVGAEFPNVHVLDWGTIAAANAATILRGDGHHLTNEGRKALAATVAGVMGEAPKQPGDCLKTQFKNDAGANVNGSDTPPPRPVGPTTTTGAKAPTTTVAAGGGTPTTKPAPVPTTVVTIPPTTQVPPTTAAPPVTRPRTTTTLPAPPTTTLAPPP